MIIIYGLNSTGTTFICRLLNRAWEIQEDKRRIVVEPWSALARPEEFLQRCRHIMAARERRDLMGRWQGRNERPAEGGDLRRLHELFTIFDEQFPGAGGLKTLEWAWYDEMVEHWPAVRFVEVRRSLAGFLKSLARPRPTYQNWNARWEWYEVGGGWLADPEAEPVWAADAEVVLGYGDLPGDAGKLRPLVRAACHRQAQYEHYDEYNRFGDRTLCVDYAQLCAEYDLMMPLLLEHCGMEADCLSGDELRRSAAASLGGRAVHAPGGLRPRRIPG